MGHAFSLRAAASLFVHRARGVRVLKRRGPHSRLFSERSEKTTLLLRRGLRFGNAQQRERAVNGKLTSLNYLDLGRGIMQSPTILSVYQHNGGSHSL